MLARLCRSCNPKNIPPHRCGPAMQAPTSKRQDFHKNFIAISQFRHRGEHCSPALAAAATPKIFPRTLGGPAMQAPTSKRQGLCKNSIALSKFHRRGEHCSPALAAPAALKKSPPHPGAPCPHPQNAPFCRKNENSLKNLPHAANKLTLVSVTFHPRAFIINLSKHCLPRVQNGAAAWF